jgi:hypothetical protein
VIPSIETIVSDLKEGKISTALAVTMLHRHAADAYRDLRDEFAGLALQGYVAHQGFTFYPLEDARRAYGWADAMLLERAAQPGFDDDKEIPF